MVGRKKTKQKYSLNIPQHSFAVEFKKTVHVKYCKQSATEKREKKTTKKVIKKDGVNTNIILIKEKIYQFLLF